MTTVEARGIVYAAGLGEPIEAFGVVVAADDGPAHISAVGWEIESPSGGAQLFLTPRSQHPQPPLPYTIPAATTATWMMTRPQIVDAVENSAFKIHINLESATLRPFVTANGERVRAEGTVPLMG